MDKPEGKVIRMKSRSAGFASAPPDFLMLDEKNQNWARAIADACASMGVDLAEASARVRRIVADAELHEKVMSVVPQLGKETIVANAERTPHESGRVDVTISIVPAAFGIRSRALQKIPLVKMLEDESRKEMRAQVARYEVATTFGQPHTALPLLISKGLS